MPPWLLGEESPLAPCRNNAPRPFTVQAGPRWSPALLYSCSTLCHRQFSVLSSWLAKGIRCRTRTLRRRLLLHAAAAVAMYVPNVLSRAKHACGRWQGSKRRVRRHGLCRTVCLGWVFRLSSARDRAGLRRQAEGVVRGRKHRVGWGGRSGGIAGVAIGGNSSRSSGRSSNHSSNRSCASGGRLQVRPHSFSLCHVAQASFSGFFITLGPVLCSCIWTSDASD